MKIDDHQINLNSILNEKHEADFSVYVDFCINNAYDGTDYSELHHILPRSQFPEYINDSWNIVRLKYENHILAHEILASIMPIGSYIHPLKFMLQYNKSSELISELRKKSWARFKTTESYSIWNYKRTEFCKEAYAKNGKYHHHMVTMAKLANKEENKSQKSENIKKYWTEEKRNKKSLQMIKLYLDNPELKNVLSKKSKDYWDSDRSKESKEKIISNNKKEENKKKNSVGLKAAWADPEKRNNFLKNRIGKVWWTNGITSIKSESCPGDDWTRGRSFKFTKEMSDKREATKARKKQ